MNTFLTIGLMLTIMVSWAQETLLDYIVLVNNDNGEGDTIRYSYDSHMNIDTIFYPNAVRIYSSDTLKSISDWQGLHRFEYLIGLVNEYLTADGDEYLRSVSLMGDNHVVLQRVFYYEDGSHDHTVTYQWNDKNCLKRNSEVNTYDYDYVSPYLKELKYWRLGNAGSTNYIKEKINGDDVIEFDVYDEQGRHPLWVSVEGPGYNWDYYYYYIQKEIPTVGEVYDFDIGNEFHANRWHIDTEVQIGTNLFSNITITDKYYSANTDTVFYTRDVKTAFHQNGTSHITYNYYKDTVIYTNLDSLVSYNISHKTYVDSVLYNGRLIHESYSNDNTYLYIHNYVVGFGKSTYRKYFNDWSIDIREGVDLLYIKKGDEEWGVPHDIVLPPPPADTLTIREAFDFEIEDVFHYYHYIVGMSLNRIAYSNRVVIDKYYSNDNNTLFYIWNVKEEGDYWSYPEYDTVHNKFEYIDTTKYYHLDNNVRTISHETSPLVFYEESIITHFEKYNGKKIFKIEYRDEGWDYTTFTFEHVRGLGKVIYSKHRIMYEAYNSDTLIYFNKSGEEWGTPHHLFVSVDEIPSQPVTVLSVDYYDMMGRKISKPNHGFYIERKTTDKGVISKKHYIQ